MKTTQVTAYVANDGSLWLDADECADKNRDLQAGVLYKHIDTFCSGARNDQSDVTDVLEYVMMYFNEIKAILEEEPNE